MIYVTKPQQVEAVRYTGDNYDELYDLTDGSITKATIMFPTLTFIGDERKQRIDNGDWIVKYDTDECVAFSDKGFREKFEEEQ